MKSAIKYAIVAIIAATISASATDLPDSMKSGEDLAAFAGSLEHDVAAASEREAVSNIQISRLKAEIEQLKAGLAKSSTHSGAAPVLPSSAATPPAPTPAPTVLPRTVTAPVLPTPTPTPTAAPEPAPSADGAGE